MDMASPTQKGGDYAVFDSFSQKTPSYTSVPSFGPSLHQQHITNHDQSRSYIPLAISSTHNPLNHNKSQNSTADSHSELITNLKIRIAVLENDLAYATKDKDEAIKSSITIARALGNMANNPELATTKVRESDTEELEELRVEVKRLRRENGLLWGRIETREDSHIVSYDNSPNTVYRVGNTYQVSGKESGRSHSGHPIIDAAIKKISAQDAPNRSQRTVEFNEETQLPKIVNLERLEDGSQAVPSREPILPYTPSRRSIHDINTSNLDDVLASDNEDMPEMKIEDQLRYQERANADIPVPAIRKAGFVCTPEKAIRGDDYANRGYANRNNYYARFNNRNAPTGPRPFDIPPDMPEGTSIWASPQQRDDEINSHMRASDSREFKFPDYFRHGLSYVPKEDDFDTFRGVHIGGLPKDIDLRDVLARVRGGRIYSSVLLNTMSICGSNSALVTFIKQADAEAYVEYANAHPITFESSDSDNQHVATAIVTHIHTPTFPFSPGKLKTIFEFNRTRILTVRNFPQQISLRRLESDLSGRTRIRAERMLEWYIDEEGTLRMEFSNVDAAGSAFGMLSNMNSYRDFNLELQFEKDNCEGDLEDLEKEAEKRKPMFPKTELGKKEETPQSNSFGNTEVVNDSMDVVEPGLNIQRKRLAALQRHHDAIPSLRGKGLQSSSWADEVIEEFEDNTPIPAFYSQTEELAVLKSNEFSKEKDTLRPQTQLRQTHSNTTSVSTLVGPIEAPRKDEDTSTAPVTPQHVPRIITGKQWLLELTAKEPSSSTSASIFTPPFASPPALTPSTPNSNEATPRPRLTLSTTSLPSKITSKSPEPSSAEYSLHSFASSAVSVGDDSPQFALPKETNHVQDHTQSPAPVSSKPTSTNSPNFGGPLFSAAGHPVHSGRSSQLSQPVISTPSAQALNTFKNTIRDADTNVYFEPGVDTEKAILDSEAGSPKGSDCEQHEALGTVRRGKSTLVKVGGNLKPEEELATKMNPDEIDLCLESETEAEGAENQGLFQKELSLRADGQAEMHGSDPLLGGEED